MNQNKTKNVIYLEYYNSYHIDYDVLSVKSMIIVRQVYSRHLEYSILINFRRIISFLVKFDSKISACGHSSFSIQLHGTQGHAWYKDNVIIMSNDVPSSF